MTRERQREVLELLLVDGGWMTGSAIADRLGVSARSVRTYVAALNDETGGEVVVHSGAAGYRVDRAAAAALETAPSATAPERRVRELIRTLLVSQSVALDEWARAHFVSDTTTASDVARARAIVERFDGVRLVRVGWEARLDGAEVEKRALMLRLVRDALPDGALDVRAVRRAIADDGVADGYTAFKTMLTAEVGALGYGANEFAASETAMHAAVAVLRVRSGHPLPVPDASAAAPLAPLVARIAQRAFGEALPDHEATTLATLLHERIAPHGGGEVDDGDVASAVRDAIARAAHAYNLVLGDAAFLTRLTRHVSGFVQRAGERKWQPNPLARSIKAAHPLVFDVAVSVANDLATVLGTEVDEDEIAYIAIHIGGELERHRGSRDRLSTAIVCPGYYELPDLLTTRITQDLGNAIEVSQLVTRIDPDWSAIDADIVLTTIDPPRPDERTLRIAPFLGESDIDRIARVIARVRRTKRFSGLRSELEAYVSETAFIRPVNGDGGVSGIIRRLAEPLRTSGVIDAEHIEQALQREAMSSTAFTPTLAMPHAREMTASQTALAIGIADPPVEWGGARVQVVVFTAFAARDRDRFQRLLEQFVEVFSDHQQVERLVRRGTTLDAFLDELVAIIGDSSMRR